MDEAGTIFCVVVICHPTVLLHAAKRGGNLCSSPHRIRPVLGLHYSDTGLQGCWSVVPKLPLKPLSKAWEHCGASRKHDIREECLPHINVTFLDALPYLTADTHGLEADSGWIEEHLWTLPALICQLYFTAIWKCVADGVCPLRARILGTIAVVLLHLANRNLVHRGGEANALL